jgi:hypothetical protein
MGEGQLHPGSLQRSRTRPGDGVLVGHADHEAFLSIQQTGYRAGLTHDFIRFGLLSDFFAISYQLSAIGYRLSAIGYRLSRAIMSEKTRSNAAVLC